MVNKKIKKPIFSWSKEVGAAYIRYAPEGVKSENQFVVFENHDDCTILVDLDKNNNLIGCEILKWKSLGSKISKK